MREKGAARISSFRNLWLICNPQAGAIRKRARRVLDDVSQELRLQGHGFRMMPTEGPGHATQLSREAVDQGADLVLVLGGDGTINEAAAGLAYSAVPLGVLPAGTANVLCRELGYGRKIHRALKLLPGAEPSRIALGKAVFERGGEERYFVCMLGAGLDAQIVKKVNPKIKARLGKLAYWIAAWSAVAKRVPSFDALIEDRSIRTSFLLASRVRNYGGDLEICRNADLLSNRLAVAAFRGDYAYEYIKYFFGILSGRLDRIDGVSLLSASQLTLRPVEGKRIPVQVDGELAGELPVRLSAVPDALTLLMPAEHARKPGSMRAAACA